MMRTTFLIFFLVISLTAASSAAAQESTPLELSLRKDFGYSSFSGGEMQGTFTMRVSGPDALERVVFLIDGESIGESTTSPFRLQFDTGSFDLGRHTLSAIGYTRSGQELRSNEQVREFVTASQGFEGAMDILLPLLAVILLAGAISWAIPSLFMRGKTQSLAPGASRNYAPLGGAICPKCGRPFAVHIYGLNVLIGKFDRCPYCGKWSLVQRASPAALKAAEAAELEQAQALTPTIPDIDEQEKMRRDLESSRYQDL